MKVESKKSTPKIKITLATKEDALQILQIQQKTWLATYPNEMEGITKDDILSLKIISDERCEQVQNQIENYSDTIRIWVAKDSKSQIVGFCRVAKIPSKHELRAIYILPQFQGLGLGKKFMEEALNWLGNDEDIFLHVAKYNTGAINFYKKFGFEIACAVDASETVSLPSGKIIPELKMILSRYTTT